MDADLRQSMLRYYDQRAAEYEEAYVLGTGTASIPDPDVFRREASELTGIAARLVRGRIIDLACGTGHWLPHYAGQCSNITLFDQSARMLDRCRTKVASLDIADRTSIVQGDVFGHAFDEHAYDTALVGFLISHLSEDEERRLFELLRHMLDSDGRFLIFDSAYSTERRRFNAKVERQERRLNDGSQFEIYKRYLDRQDVARWAESYGADLAMEYYGIAFLAVSGRFREPRS
jgi:ubiquinone/menaquinone biosynthesis C-methylase UbiE